VFLAVAWASPDLEGVKPRFKVLDLVVTVKALCVPFRSDRGKRAIKCLEEK
jgi:hypothetical protein